MNYLNNLYECKHFTIKEHMSEAEVFRVKEIMCNIVCNSIWEEGITPIEVVDHLVVEGNKVVVKNEKFNTDLGELTCGFITTTGQIGFEMCEMETLIVPYLLK